MILILFMYMILASTFTIGKAALFYVQPIFFIGMRMLVAGGILFTFLYIFRRHWLRFEKKHLYLFAQITFFHIYIAYVLEFIALQNISSAKACLLYNLSPFITALFSYLFFAEKLSTKKWVGLAIGFSGFLPTLIGCVPTEGPSILCISIPEILLLGSVVSSVQGWIVMKRLVRHEGYSPVLVNAVGMLSGGILALLTSLLFETGPLIYDKPDAVHMVILYGILAIIAANIIFYNLYGWLLHQYSATFLSFAGFTCPIFAAVYGWLFLHEVVSGSFFLSVGIIVIGLYLFYQEELIRVKN